MKFPQPNTSTQLFSTLRIESDAFGVRSILIEQILRLVFLKTVSLHSEQVGALLEVYKLYSPLNLIALSHLNALLLALLLQCSTRRECEGKPLLYSYHIWKAFLLGESVSVWSNREGFLTASGKNYIDTVSSWSGKRRNALSSAVSALFIHFPGLNSVWHCKFPLLNKKTKTVTTLQMAWFRSITSHLLFSFPLLSKAATMSPMSVKS